MLTHPHWGETRLLTAGSWSTRVIDTKNDTEACSPWRMFRDILFMYHFRSAAQITIMRHNPRRWSPFSNFVSNDLQPYRREGSYDSQWCNICNCQVPLSCSDDGEILLDATMHVASSEHLHHCNIFLSNTPGIRVEDAHTVCLAAKQINDLTLPRDRRYFDESRMLPCKLTEMKFYDKMPAQNSFPHQPIERWCVSNSATAPFNTDQVRKHVSEKWQFGNNDVLAAGDTLHVAIRDDALVPDMIKPMSWFYRNNPDVSPKTVSRYLTGTTTTTFSPTCGPTQLVLSA